VSAPNDVVSALDRAGYRLTQPRRIVAGMIGAQAGHFTADDLVREANGRRLGVGRATIFRLLELLVDLGAVERLDLPTGGHAYVRCEPAHHHHIVCSSCGRATGIPDPGAIDVAREVARRTGYRVDVHRLELFGICPDCQTSPSVPA
jgi:Fe2+ or Zn2+ uptake regulation protein